MLQYSNLEIVGAKRRVCAFTPFLLNQTENRQLED